MTRYSQWCAEDHVLCCLCFGCFPLDQLWRDPDGQLTDVCVPCQVNEAYSINAHQYLVDRYKSERDG